MIGPAQYSKRIQHALHVIPATPVAKESYQLSIFTPVEHEQVRLPTIGTMTEVFKAAEQHIKEQWPTMTL